MSRETYHDDEKPDPQPCPHCEKLIWFGASDHVCPVLIELNEDALRERENLRLEFSVLLSKYLKPIPRDVRDRINDLINAAYPVDEELAEISNTRAGERQDERRAIDKYFGG